MKTNHTTYHTQTNKLLEFYWSVSGGMPIVLTLSHGDVSEKDPLIKTSGYPHNKVIIPHENRAGNNGWSSDSAWPGCLIDDFTTQTFLLPLT